MYAKMSDIAWSVVQRLESHPLLPLTPPTVGMQSLEHCPQEDMALRLKEVPNPGLAKLAYKPANG